MTDTIDRAVIRWRRSVRRRRLARAFVGGMCGLLLLVALRDGGDRQPDTDRIAWAPHPAAPAAPSSSDPSTEGPAIADPAGAVSRCEVAELERVEDLGAMPVPLAEPEAPAVADVSGRPHAQLLQDLESDDPEMRFSAACALSLLGDSRGDEALLGIATSDGQYALDAFRWMRVHRHPELERVARAALAGSDRLMLGHACEALGFLRAHVSRAELENALSHKALTVRADALYALARSGDLSAMYELLDLLEEAGPYDIAHVARRALSVDARILDLVEDAIARAPHGSSPRVRTLLDSVPSFGGSGPKENEEDS